MSREHEAINKNQDKPVTAAVIRDALRNLGLQSGMTVLMHSSLSSLGWVCGGPVAVIMAIEEILGPDGTLVMPAHSSEYSDPEAWENPPVPESWWQIIRDEMPCFQKDLTPTRGMGAIPETFRHQAGVVRSSHPSCSFAAWGKHKDFIIQDNHYDYSQNMQSPLGRVYELNGHVLLLGVDHDRNTSLHLAEYLADFPKQIVEEGFPVFENGKRQWCYFENILYNSDDFVPIGRAFEKTAKVKSGRVGAAEARLMNQKQLVDFATDWMTRHRNLKK